MRRNVLMVGSLMVLSCPIALSAQAAVKIDSGDKVRLSAKSLGTVDRIGVLTKVERDKLLLTDPGANGSPWEIDLRRVSRLEVMRPNGGNHKHRGALIGMITGFVVLGGVGYAATHCTCEFDGIGAIAAGPGAGIGALTGFFIGRSQKTDGWARVPLPLK